MNDVLGFLGGLLLIGLAWGVFYVRELVRDWRNRK
jgi:hypothetical protein